MAKSNKSVKASRTVADIFCHALLIVMCIIWILPFVYLVAQSFRGGVNLGMYSTTFFPKKWTAEERNNGFVNYIMGLCFISEGAIPYAAGDPARVLPACIIGSAISGCLSMAFGCTLQAPHGGIFVFPTVGNPLMYIVALVVGSVAGALILSFLKKDKR